MKWLNVKFGEGVIFSPNCLHGNVKNLEKTCIETYAVRSHPEFAQETGEIIVSYITSYTGDYKNANINSYRPRFIRIQLEKVK